MDYRILHDELQDTTYADLSDETAADALNSESETELRPLPMTRMYIWAAGCDAFRRLDAAIAANTPLSGLARVMLETLRYAGFTEIHLDDPSIEALIATLVQGHVFTAAERDALEGMATTTVSRAEQLGLGVVTEGDVVLARGGQW